MIICESSAQVMNVQSPASSLYLSYFDSERSVKVQLNKDRST